MIHNHNHNDYDDYDEYHNHYHNDYDDYDDYHNHYHNDSMSIILSMIIIIIKLDYNYYYVNFIMKFESIDLFINC